MSISNEHLTLNATITADGFIHLTGSIKSPSKYQQKYLMAANPIDRMMNYTGSGLPFTSPFIAFENTPNYYEIPESGEIEAHFKYPNSYYVTDTQEKIVPSIFITLKLKNQPEPIFYQLKLVDPLPLKTSTTYRPEFKKGPVFYAKKEEVLGVPPSQEWILRNIGELKAKHGFA